MELTPEQIAIVQSTGNIKINAVAGSGKTTTVIEYARTRPAGSRILYLAFNKSVRTEATKKFADKGLHNVQVETAHSLAYRHVVMRSRYQVKARSYTSGELVELLSLASGEERHGEYILANHIHKFAAYFCNSDKRRVQELDYRETVTDSKALAFVNACYDYIESQTRIFLGKMELGEVEIMHDFYLKKFQLSNPVLPYDYILFDEGQDASPAMLDIFFRQHAIKVIVGDTHQQIYGWRHAVNSLEKADYTTYQLSTSFRFGQDIAALGMRVLESKKMLGPFDPITIHGKGGTAATQVRATLARTNLGLLLKAIEYVTNNNVKRIYFEGSIHSYTYADEGASLYDVLNLYNEKKHLIRDKLIKKMKDMAELTEYIEKTDDVQLAMMVDIVEEYGDDIPTIIRSIKEKHVDDKAKAEMIFSTIHRCKGMEYDSILLVNDFLTEEKLEKILEEARKDPNKAWGLAKLNEEINLLYVAVTRSRNIVEIPEALLPKDYPASRHIKPVKQSPESNHASIVMIDSPAGMNSVNKRDSEKAYTVDAVRTRHKDAYARWTPALDDKLTVMFCEGASLDDMATHFGRSRGAIVSRVKRLELEDLYGRSLYG